MYYILSFAALHRIDLLLLYHTCTKNASVNNDEIHMQFSHIFHIRNVYPTNSARYCKMQTADASAAPAANQVKLCIKSGKDTASGAAGFSCRPAALSAASGAFAGFFTAIGFVSVCFSRSPAVSGLIFLKSAPQTTQNRCRLCTGSPQFGQIIVTHLISLLDRSNAAFGLLLV